MKDYLYAHLTKLAKLLKKKKKKPPLAIGSAHCHQGNIQMLTAKNTWSFCVNIFQITLTVKEIRSESDSVRKGRTVPKFPQAVGCGLSS